MVGLVVLLCKFVRGSNPICPRPCLHSVHHPPIDYPPDGTAVYNGSIQLSGFDYPEGEQSASLTKSPLLVRTPKSMASPALTKSPLLTRQVRRASADRDERETEMATRGPRGSYEV